MAKKYLQEAAARTPAARWNTAPNTPPDVPDEGTLSAELNFADDVAEVPSHSEPESDCGYAGGVNMDNSDQEGSSWMDGDSSEESLSELEGEDLELNLESLQEEGETLEDNLTIWEVLRKKSLKDWKRVEQNRSLGYTGTSDRTRRRREKESRDRAAFRESAKTS
jgi:hypothetical protein